MIWTSLNKQRQSVFRMDFTNSHEIRGIVLGISGIISVCDTPTLAHHPQLRSLFIIGIYNICDIFFVAHGGVRLGGVCGDHQLAAGI